MRRGLWAIDALVKFTDLRERTRAAGQLYDRRGPLQRLLGWMVDHPRSSQWGPWVLLLVGGGIAFGLRWAATIAGILLLWALLEWAWRRIRPTDEVRDDRLARVRALQAQGDLAAIRLLGQYVHDPLGPVSRRAALALADIGSPEATEALRRAVTDAGTQPVTRWARFALWVFDLDGSTQRGKELEPS
jgi:HEAT repeat protein